jgi:hypothetical protein
MVSPVLLLSFAGSGNVYLLGWASLAQNIAVEQRVFRNEHPPVCRRADRWTIVQTEGAGSPALIRFALAIGASPMLETARIGGDAGSL